jgi:hypothetical protein
MSAAAIRVPSSTCGSPSCSRVRRALTVATAPLPVTAAAAPATVAAHLTARPAPEAPVIPPEAVIPAAEATTKSQTCQQGVVNEVKVRGGKGVLNGTPFLLLARQLATPVFASL